MVPSAGPRGLSCAIDKGGRQERMPGPAGRITPPEASGPTPPADAILCRTSPQRRLGRLRVPATPITIERRELRPHLAVKSPDFAHPSVLVTEPWEFVALYLRRKGESEALFYWEQAQALYSATVPLPPTASPITAYYCCLNATKALLKAHHASVEEQHGLSGKFAGGKAVLKNEHIKVLGKGVFPSLAKFLGEADSRNEYTLYELAQSTVFIHRAFCLTFRTSPELYIPIDNLHFVRKPASDESWFRAEVPPKYQHSQTLGTLPAQFEIDHGIEGGGTIRMKRRFRWRRGSQEASLGNLKDYHMNLRKHIRPIIGTPTRWYIRRDIASIPALAYSELPVTFAMLHRLSELARYTPLLLNKHLAGQHGWLLAEFLKMAPAQYVFQVASEITGLYFHRPWASGLSTPAR